MAKLQSPLLSIDAHGSMGKTLTYSSRYTGPQVRAYHKPNKPITSNQYTQRRITEFLVAHWKGMPTAERDSWNNASKEYGLNIPGYMYFLRQSHKDLYGVEGLCLFWSFNKIVGTQVLDYSGRSIEGNLGPSYPANAPLPVDSKLVKFNKALQFDGSDDYCIASSHVFPGINTPKVAIETWIYPTTLGARVYEFSVDPIVFYINGNGALDVFLYTTGDVRISLASAVGYISTGKWWHTILTYEDNNAALIINGEVVDTVTDVSGPIRTANRQLHVGGRTGGGGGYKFFTGKIDEVRILNRIITPTEAKFLYHYGLKESARAKH